MGKLKLRILGYLCWFAAFALAMVYLFQFTTKPFDVFICLVFGFIALWGLYQMCDAIIKLKQMRKDLHKPTIYEFTSINTKSGVDAVYLCRKCTATVVREDSVCICCGNKLDWRDVKWID